MLFIASFPFVINFHILFFNWSTNILRQQLSKGIKVYLIAVLALGSIQVAAATEFTNQPFQDYCYKYPCEAVSFLRERDEYHNLKMFNYYGWGGYLIWTYQPGRLFIDGRMPQCQINNTTMLEEYYEFFKKGRTGEMLDKYEVELVLFKKEKSKKQYDRLEKALFLINDADIKSKNRYLLKFLSNNQNWKIVFENDTSLIFLKNK